MIRVAHFSDLHYGAKTLAEADRCFSAAIDRAKELRVEAAVISGDSTDHSLDLHSPAATKLMSQVRHLADHCPVLMLQGTFSHEPPGTLSAFRLLGGRHPVHVADRIEQVALTDDWRWQASADWRFDATPTATRALFTCVPTVNKAAVAASVAACDAAQAVGEQLAVLLRGFGASNARARAAGVPTMLVSHGTVFGCLSEHGVPMAGFDHEFTTGVLFSAKAQAVMLGHIHRHQGWSQDGPAGRQCIAYAGSIGRFHYGEEGEKGFLLWEVDADGASYRQQATPARRTIDIVFEGRPDLDRLREVIDRSDLAGASVRVRWTVAEEDRAAVDRTAIERLLADAAETKLEGVVVPVVRSRAAGISRLAGIEDKLRAWAEVAHVAAEPLLACLEALRGNTPEAIANALLCDAGADDHDTGRPADMDEPLAA